MRRLSAPVAAFGLLALAFGCAREPNAVELPVSEHRDRNAEFSGFEFLATSRGSAPSGSRTAASCARTWTPTSRRGRR